jgi:phosphoketolase
METGTLTPQLLPDEIDERARGVKRNTLTPQPLHKTDACWRAAYYLSAGQIYLSDNPLLKRQASHVWLQGPNGFTNRDPGFPGYVVDRKAEIERVYPAPMKYESRKHYA